MKILAIDSSGLVATVALLSDEILVCEYTVHNKKTHSQTLLPMIQSMMEMADVEIGEVDAVAISSGPGSFTGLRIGAATAKGIAQALDVPIIPVPSLEGLAYNLTGVTAYVCPMMDARRQQVYYGIYDVSGDVPQIIENQAAAPIEDVIKRVNELGHPVIFVGDGVPVFRECFGKVTVPWSIGSPDVLYQKASAVAALGKKYMESGKTMDAAAFVPTYLRLSQAERERLERMR